MGFLYRSENCLAFFYSLGGVSALVSTICTAIVWLHWRIVLNTCAGNFQSYNSYYDEKDCGCFLYARDTLTYFVGSHVGWCYWATFGLLIPIFFCFCYGCYHVYRVCCKTVKPQHAKMRARARSTEVMELTIEQEEPRYEDNISPYYWTPAAIISFLMLAYSLVHAILLTDGFFSTCKQYRNRIVKISQATGPMVSL